MHSPVRANRHPLTTITGAQRASGQTHSRARSHQDGADLRADRAQLTLFHASGCAAPMATHSITSSARAQQSEKIWRVGVLETTTAKASKRIDALKSRLEQKRQTARC
jgi:hypothetical protein